MYTVLYLYIFFELIFLSLFNAIEYLLKNVVCNRFCIEPLNVAFIV